ncbi:MAG: ATP-dependent RNA helicase HrpA, partial [Syntrophales bacterium]|nr:ATP-dependent RNA helicase HrpA [Syntrophales bacterium]
MHKRTHNWRRILPRRELVPEITYDPDLPITARRDDIIRTIRDHQVTIISGETGSGKTTQIPKMCLEAGRGLAGIIGCTQPRRVAAVTVAERLAEELREAVGRTVAYKIRFDEKMGPHPLIKVMTDGILLVEAQSDRYLRRYDTIIVDEAHERNLNIDFVLGILRSILPKRPDLKVIVTSATLDTEKFSKAFSDAPIIEVSGRMYDVDVLWHPLDPDLEETGEITYIDAAVEAVATIRDEHRFGDILIFMPTEQDILECCEVLTGRYGDEADVLPLFARLPWSEQKRIFQPASRSRIIVATNIAETSVTIPNIRYVIDTGLARISQYNARSRTSALPVRPISRSSADQRKGRCGRIGHGVCIRLYSDESYQERTQYTPPEILRSNLAGVILQMLYLNLGDIHDFPFVDQPAKKNISDAIDILQELGAIRKEEKDSPRSATHPYILTEQGRKMARLPIDPRIARMMIEARKRRCPEEVAIIASGLSIVDPRERPLAKKTQADQMHALFRDPTSDFLTLLRIWKKFGETLNEVKSQNRMRKFCHEHFLSYRRMQEWRDVYRQITTIVEEETWETIPSVKEGDKPDELNAAIHKSILSGYLGNIAEKKEKNIYHGAKGREPFIFPGSALFNHAGQWIVAAEMVETSRLYARTVATIDPAWIEDVGRDLCRSTYGDPHWEKSHEDVVATETVMLFGLVIVPKRSVSFSRINPEEAAPIFIRQGLMPGEVKSRFKFLSHNLALIERLEDMENKIRRHDLIDEEAIFNFYAGRLPGIANVAGLRKFIHKRGSDAFLFMEEADIIRQTPDEETIASYPDHVAVAGIVLPLTYSFEPGKIHDGVTMKIPSGIIPSISVSDLDWSVPGILREKISGLLKGLPKEYRKKLPPAVP